MRGRKRAAAQGLQQVPARFGQDVAAGVDVAHGEDDRGDVDDGERGVHARLHPGTDRRPGRRELPRQAPAAEDELRWGAGPAETAAASLAVALVAYGPGTYARVLASGHVTAGLTPTAAQQVTDALNTRPVATAPPPRARRRGLGHGWKGIDAGR
ncbi:hypothetical protein [Streptomyces sp. NPDC092307]|uniref:hypothetical protein n=1 Tax=Streptomyces sp. NPDC092307 TaxID=3366013 RepID=UPI00381DB21D